MIIEVASENDMKSLAEKIGRRLSGGEIFELIGDVGAGKTTFVKGLAKGLEIEEDIQSPSFTISRVYDARDDIQLSHYDFYRLDTAGLLADELREVTQDPKIITVIEWAGIVDDILPENRITIKFESPSEGTRRVIFPNNFYEFTL